jgi:hypothetical protein
MNNPTPSVELAPGVVLGETPFVLIAGPCVVELPELVMRTASTLKGMAKSLEVPLISKVRSIRRIGHLRNRPAQLELSGRWKCCGP